MTTTEVNKDGRSVVVDWELHEKGDEIDPPYVYEWICKGIGHDESIWWGTVAVCNGDDWNKIENIEQEEEEQD